MDQLLTEGARRALELAGRLAHEGGQSTVLPVHLFWALMLDESRASEILADHGIALERMQSESPLPRIDSLDDGSPGEMAEERTPDRPVPHAESVRDILIAARRMVAGAGRQAEIGTEFLLYGLVEIDSEIADLLRGYGLERERVVGRALQVSGQERHELEVDFAIAWQGRTEAEQVGTLRILDAAANRVREGLRVVEDYVRFLLDDGQLSRLAKECRHELAAILASFPTSGLIASRDTLGDVGTSIRTSAEVRRDSPRDVLVANLKRSQEAVRTLEEFGKVISPDTAEPLGRLRYRLYTLEKAILTCEAARQRLDGCLLYMLVTDDACHHGAGPAVLGAISGGASIIQVREKAMSDRKLLEQARRVREWARQNGALCIMNDRPDLAVAADADGVHVGQDELPVREVRRIVGPNRLVGVSTHTIEQARQAVLDGADYLGVGPVFPSGTKQFDQFAGLEFVRQAAAEIALPWFAIGGITPSNVSDVVAAGARRVAVSGVLCGAADPAQVAAQLVAALTRTPAT